MRKILIFGVFTLFISALIGCSSCKREKNVMEDDTLQVTNYNVENCVSADRETMFLTYGGDYRWFETCITLNNFLDEENDEVITNLTNIFQVVTEKERGYDTKVVFIMYADNEKNIQEVETFCVGDNPLNDKEIKVTFKEAFDRMMQANFPKPHSKQCVLRNELGPKQCNPQYVFGNNKAQIYVDAVTGDVTDKNPAFGGDFGKPLGEWP